MPRSRRSSAVRWYRFVSIGGGELVALLDPLEARVQQRREGEVRVAGRVGAAELGPRRLLRARACRAGCG